MDVPGDLSLSRNRNGRQQGCRYNNANAHFCNAYFLAEIPAKGSASALLSARRCRSASLQLGDPLLGFFEKLGFLEFFDQPLVVGQGFGLLRRFAAVQGLREVEIERVAMCETRIIFEHFPEAVDRARVVLQPVIEIADAITGLAQTIARLAFELAGLGYQLAVRESLQKNLDLPNRILGGRLIPLGCQHL